MKMAGRLAIFMVTIVIMLFILEFIVRIFPHPSLSSLLRYSNYPYYGEIQCRPSSLTVYEIIPNSAPGINSFGMIDAEHTLDKGGAYRILVLGDSVTAGGSNYPQMLQRLLNGAHQGSKYDVMNAALPGIGIRQYMNFLLHSSLKYDPDMILMGLCINDFETWSPVIYLNQDNLLEYANPFPRASRILMNRFLFRHSSLYRFIMVRIERLISVYPDNDSSQSRLEEGRYCLQKMKRFCAAHKIKLVALILPYFKNFSEYEKQEKKHYSDIKESLVSLKITYLDLVGHFDTLDSALLRSLRNSEDDYVHCNESGHRIISELIFEYLIDSNLLT